MNKANQPTVPVGNLHSRQAAVESPDLTSQAVDVEEVEVQGQEDVFPTTSTASYALSTRAKTASSSQIPEESTGAGMSQLAPSAEGWIEPKRRKRLTKRLEATVQICGLLTNLDKQEKQRERECTDLHRELIYKVMTETRQNKALKQEQDAAAAREEREEFRSLIGDMKQEMPSQTSKILSTMKEIACTQQWNHNIQSPPHSQHPPAASQHQTSSSLPAASHSFQSSADMPPCPSFQTPPTGQIHSPRPFQIPSSLRTPARPHQGPSPVLFHSPAPVPTSPSRYSDPTPLAHASQDPGEKPEEDLFGTAHYEMSTSTC